MVLSVRVHYAPHIEHYLIHSSSKGLQLDGSRRYFAHIPGLIQHYCSQKDELPVKLNLPSTLMEMSVEDLANIACLGQDFWTSPLAQSSHLHRSEYHTTVSSYKRNASQHMKQASMSVPEAPTTERHVPISRNRSAPEVDEIFSHLSDGYENRRKSLTQINHSDHSPFQSVFPVNEESESESSGAIHSSHDYVNLPISPDVFVEGANGFQPIIPSQTNSMQNILQELDREIHKLMVSVTGSEEVSSKLVPGIVVPENRLQSQLSYQTDHVEKFTKVSTNRARMVSDTDAHKKVEKTVFTFDIGPSDNTKSVEIIQPENFQVVKAGINIEPAKHMLGVHKEPSPLSPTSQYSSPAYCEPYDSLIGKIDGVSEVQGAIKVDDSFLRKKKLEMFKRRQDKMNSLHFSQNITTIPEHTITKNAVVMSYSSTSHEQSQLTYKNVKIHNGAMDHCEALSNRNSVQIEKLLSFTQPLDSTMAADPKYRISLQEIPLSQGNPLSPATQRNNHIGNGKKKAERSVSLKTFEAPTNFTVNALRARSLPRDTAKNAHPPPLTCKPPSGCKDNAGSNNPSTQNAHISSNGLKSLFSQSFEENFFHSKEVSSPSINHPFPDYTSSRTSYSESSALDDLLRDISPELTFEPSAPLTFRNVLRVSTYDNCHTNGFSGSSECGQALHSPCSQTGRAEGSVMTDYCVPWDTSRDMWQQLLHPSTTLDVMFHKMEEENFVLSASVQSNRLPAMHDNSLERSASGIGSGGGSTLDRLKWENVDSAAETTPQPGYADCAVDDDNIDTVSAIVHHEPVSDDEGVELQPPIYPPVTTSDNLYGSKRRGKMSCTKVQEYISKLAGDTNSMFGLQVSNFVKCTIEGTEGNPHTVLRYIRQFMNGIKNYLVQSGEKELSRIIETERSTLGDDEFLNVDALIEGALHKCVVKPLKSHIHKLFIDEYRRNGSLQQMHDSIEYARGRSPQELGIKASLHPPNGTAMEVIRFYLQRLKRVYSPLKKLENLLGATSSLVNAVQANDTASRTSHDTAISLGADDFLPMFIYVLIQAGITTIEIEADYMWGLLHPCLLAGEGGYYLTTLSSAVHLLKNLKTLMETGPEQIRMPCVGDLQGFIKIIIPNEKQDSIITKTLPVRPNMTTKDVCNMIAHKFRVTNPQDYGLYIIADGAEVKLGDNRCPQDIKQNCAYHQQECIFAFKRNNAKFVWPVNIRK